MIASSTPLRTTIPGAGPAESVGLPAGRVSRCSATGTWRSSGMTSGDCTRISDRRPRPCPARRPGASMSTLVVIRRDRACRRSAAGSARRCRRPADRRTPTAQARARARDRSGTRSHIASSWRAAARSRSRCSIRNCSSWSTSPTRNSRRATSDCTSFSAAKRSASDALRASLRASSSNLADISRVESSVASDSDRGVVQESLGLGPWRRRSWRPLCAGRARASARSSPPRRPRHARRRPSSGAPASSSALPSADCCCWRRR